MRFFEFGTDGTGDDKFVMVLKNYIGRAASKKASAKLNWSGLNAVLRSSGFELGADYETFKAMYDASPEIQNLIRDFDQNSVTLNVPGAPDDQTQTPQDGEDSEEVVAKMASGAVDQQISQNQQGVQV